MSRRPDRELPTVRSSAWIWVRTLPIFLAIVTASALALFNYQKSSSSIVSATLYALRNSEAGRRELGDEIYFRDRFPWIWGEMNQLHGRINICFGVKGTKAKGLMRFRSERKTRMGRFETKEWSLETEDGRTIQLLDETRTDPFKTTNV
jgi:cytochrome c oxidase assembly factor 1